MENQNNKTSRLTVVLAIIAFALGIAATLFNYFSTGKFDYVTLIAGLVIPAVVLSLVYARKTGGNG